MSRCNAKATKQQFTRGQIYCDIFVTVRRGNLTLQHIISAVKLPKGHLVRSMLASAAVPEYLYCDDYLKEAVVALDFVVDLLE